MKAKTQPKIISLGSNGLQTDSMERFSHSLFVSFQWLLPAINLTVTQLDSGGHHGRCSLLQTLDYLGAPA
jgi:hypothetical protein